MPDRDRDDLTARREAWDGVADAWRAAMLPDGMTLADLDDTEERAE